MQHAYKARSLGWRLGIEQRMEHSRMVPRVELDDDALRHMARLAWRFEPHGLADVPYLRCSFMTGYEQGYHLVDSRVAR